MINSTACDIISMYISRFNLDFIEKLQLSGNFIVGENKNYHSLFCTEYELTENTNYFQFYQKT